MTVRQIARSFLITIAVAGSANATASDDDLLKSSCSAGALTVTVLSPWQVNVNAPWAWDKGSVISKDSKSVKFRGSRCEGSVKAFIVNGSQAKGPILLSIK